MNDTIATAARDAFEAETATSTPPPDLAPLYEAMTELRNERLRIEAEVDRCERLIKGYTRSGHMSRLPKIEAALAIAASDHVDVLARIRTNDAVLEAARDARRVARRTAYDAFAFELLSDYGDVDTSDGVTRVEFVANVDDIATNVAIVDRGELAFEVGIRGDDRYFRFGFDVDVNAPRAGYASNDGTIEHREGSNVNWGSIGAMAPHAALEFATILTIAANLAARVNDALGL